MSSSRSAQVYPYLQVSWDNAEGLDVCLHMQWVTLSERNSKLGKAQFRSEQEANLLFFLMEDVTSSLKTSHSKHDPVKWPWLSGDSPAFLA